jgi:hypothetical protein
MERDIHTADTVKENELRASQLASVCEISKELVSFLYDLYFLIVLCVIFM